MTNPKNLLTDFSFRHLAWWLDHKCFGSLLLPGNLPMMVVSFPGCKVDLIRGPWQSTPTRVSILYTLDHVYDSLLKSTLHPGKETTIIGRFPGKSSEPKYLWSSHQARRQKLKSLSKSFGFVAQNPHLFYYNPTTNEAIYCAMVYS